MSKFLIGLLIALLFCLNEGHSQSVKVNGDSQDMKDFLKSKTHFILTGNKILDEGFKSAIKKYWKLTPVDFINEKDIDQLHMSPAESYCLIPTGGSWKKEDRHYALDAKDLTVIKGMLLDFSLARWGSNSWGWGANITDIAELHISYATVDYTSDFYQNLAVSQLNYSINRSVKKQLSVRKQAYTEQENAEASRLKTKILLIDKQWTDGTIRLSRTWGTGIIVPLKVLAEYPYKYKVVTEEELFKLAEEEPDNYCYLAMDPKNDEMWITIYDLGEMRMIYQKTSNSSDLDSKGIRNIQEAAEGK